ncbi:YveK family protein [Luteococcus japonicus]|uniref:YveK family protein n=1 Tax=Luteococcus japonicus TaxID=33984 RepID=UPI000B9B53B0|nr:hypothetical protein [Luteococcus japonicus]
MSTQTSPEPLTKSLVRAWPITLLMMLVGTLLGAGYAAVQPSSAESTAALYISAGKTEQGSDPAQLTTTVSNRMYSYYNLTTSGTVLKPVIEKLKLDTNVNDLREHITANVPANSMVIEVSATAATPEQAASLANAVRDSLGNAIKDVTPDQPAGLPAVEIHNYQDAADATVVSEASLPVYSILGMLAGLVGAGALMSTPWASKTNLKAKRALSKTDQLER